MNSLEKITRRQNLIMPAKINNILTHYEAISQLKNGIMCNPRFADLHTSNRCNQACRGCAYKNDIDNTIISEKNHFKILEDLLKIGVKGFDFAGGGDPLALPYIENLWKYIIQNNANFGIITNGTMLTNAQMEYIIKYATYIRISLEGSTEKEYCEYKDVSSSHWHKVLSNIKNLVSLRKKLKSNCDISIKFSVSKSLRGIEHYASGVILSKLLNIDYTTFKALRHFPEELSEEEKIFEDRLLGQCVREQDGSINKQIIPISFKNVPQCWLNPLHIVVDYLGNVYLCCYYYYRKEKHRIGNMLKDNLSDIWHSKDHWKSIREIDREDCSKVDCKFFNHHIIIEEASNNGKWEFL